MTELDPAELARRDQRWAAINDVQNRSMARATASLSAEQFIQIDSMPSAPVDQLLMELIARAMWFACTRVAELEGRL